MRANPSSALSAVGRGASCAARLTAALLALCVRAAAAAQLLPVPGLLVSADVQNLRALRYANMVAQQRDYSCGAAALATLLDYGYGFRLSETQTIEAMMQHVAQPADVLRNGFSMLDMKRYVESLGMHAVGFDVNLEALRQLRIPVIALLDVQGYSHFVVIKKVDEDLVFISDPALGQRAIDVDTFARDWHGLVLAVIGRPFLADSPLLHDNVSHARAVRDSVLRQAAPMRLDFGIPRVGSF